MLDNRQILVAAVVALGLTAVGVGPSAVSAQPTTEIDSCTTITEPGTYQLTDDIENSDADRCLVVETGDVTIDGNGNLVSGVDDDDAVGVYVDSAVGGEITVRDLTVSDWDEGVRVEDGQTDVINVDATSNIDGIKARELADGVSLERVNTFGNTDDGIELIRVAEFSIVDSETTGNDGDGMFLNEADDGTVSNTLVANNGDDGIQGDDPDMARIARSEIRDNGDDGIFVAAPDDQQSPAEDTVIQNNEVRNNGGDGIALRNLIGSDGASPITVRQSTVCDNADRQFRLEDVPNVEMTENEIC